MLMHGGMDGVRGDLEVSSLAMHGTSNKQRASLWHLSLTARLSRNGVGRAPQRRVYLLEDSAVAIEIYKNLKDNL